MDYKVVCQTLDLKPPYRFDAWYPRRLTFERLSAWTNNGGGWEKVDPDEQTLKFMIRGLVHDFVEDGRSWSDYYLKSLDRVSEGVYDVVVAQEWLD